MDEDKKKYLMIGIIVVCIGLAAGITYFNMGGSGSGGARPVVMLCDSCQATYEISAEEFKQAMRDSGAGRNMMMRGPMVLTCKECGQVAAYRATKCPECEEAFVMGDAGDDKYPDKCPACGYSAMEQRTQRK
jgi:hypothetical protein